MTRPIALLKTVWADLAGSPPAAMSPALRDQLSVIQFDRLRQRVPILYLVLAMVAVGAGLASQDDLPRFFQFALPGIMLAASLFRYITWVRRRSLEVDGAIARGYLRRVTLLSAVLMGAGSAWAVLGFVETVESSRAFPVVFIFLSAFASANCLASLPRASIQSLLIGLGPISLVMIASGGLRMAALAASVIAVSLLHVRLVASQFGEMARNLKLQAELEEQANTDALTGLLNRRAFGRILEDRIARRAEAGRFVVAMLDLDGFKPVNDRFGHSAGDNLLVMLAERLHTICGPSNPIARIGGDEFAFIIVDPKDVTAIEQRVESMARVLAESYLVHGQQVCVTASIGAARFPEDGNTVAGLLDAADAALYAVKSRLKSAKAVHRVVRQSAKKAA